MKKILISQFKLYAVYFLVIVGTLFFIQLFARTSFAYSYLTVDLHPQFSCNGGVSIDIPPIGKLFLKSHLTPWQLVFTVREINFNKFDPSWVNSITRNRSWNDILQKKEISRAILILAVLVLGFGLLGGFITLLFLRVPLSSKTFRNGLFISMVVIFLLISATSLSFDPHFMEHIHYQGVIASAPWMINMFSDGMQNIKAIGKHLKNLSNEFPLLFKQVEIIGKLEEPPSDLKVLHVSDIHNNPAAIDLISELVSDFQIDLIIDTGDITDYGTPFELAIVRKIAKLKVPYLFIPGNHDSPMVINRLKKLRVVKVLMNGTIKIKGLTIIGSADPSSYKFSSNMASEEELNQTGQKLTEYVSKQEIIPDVVAVHNVKLAAELIGKVPVLLHGHNHRYSLTEKDNTVIDNAGTTGAAGIRGLKPEGVMYSASILYWGKNKDGVLQLRAVNSIKINGIKGFFTIDRQLFN